MTAFCSVAAIALLVYAALGPGNWQPCSGLDWQFDHFVGYFTITLIVTSCSFNVGAAHSVHAAENEEDAA